MTIIVGIASPDGIVLASDSRMTRNVEGRHRILSDSSQKVFEIEGRFGVATCGQAFIGSDTIAGVMNRFLAQRSANSAEDIDAFDDALKAFFDERFDEWTKKTNIPPSDTYGPAITFLVSGYDERSRTHSRGLDSRPESCPSCHRHDPSWDRMARPDRRD